MKVEKIKRNYRGEIIKGHRELIKEEYGTGEINADGEPVVNWKYVSKFADGDGFDKREIINGDQYKIEITLPKGTVILRYGSEMGRYTAPDGTAYEKLALPYKKETIEFNRYKVVGENVKVECVVEKGFVAPGFDSSGGAVQYLHKKTVYDLIKKKIIERV